MNLYHIEESDVIATIKREMTSAASSEKDRRIVINKKLSSKYRFPLKIVFVQEGQSVIVVSAYPVRKEREK